jgi:hypothetical protein
MSWNTGKNINLRINCEYNGFHHWMTYVCWYSIKKNAPDANIEINCLKNDHAKSVGFFAWANKLNIKFEYVKKHSESNFYTITPNMLMVREWSGFTISDVKSEEITAFVDIEKGCGNFVVEEWINKKESPFDKIKYFIKPKMSSNEHKVLDLWERAKLTYTAVGW